MDAKGFLVVKTVIISSVKEAIIPTKTISLRKKVKNVRAW